MKKLQNLTRTAKTHRASFAVAISGIGCKCRAIEFLY